MSKNIIIKITSVFILSAFIINSQVLSIPVVSGNNKQPEPTQRQEASLTEENQKRLTNAVPPPVLQDSVERRNLVERLKRNNKADKIGYVFLLSDTGSVITNYTIKGKVSSLNSLLTTPQQQVCFYSTNCSGGVVVDSPDLDGSYGKNPDGVFFFTTDGNMVEWSGKFLYSEQPMTLSSAPILTYNINK